MRVKNIAHTHIHTSLPFLENLWEYIVGDVQSDVHQYTNKTGNDEDVERLRDAKVQQIYSNSTINHCR